MTFGKILFVSSNFPPVIGGSSVVYDQLCRNAADQVIAVASRLNHETNEPLGNIEQHDRSCGYTIRRLDYLRPPTTKWPNRRSRIFGLLAYDLPVMARTLINLAILIIQYRATTVCIGELVYNGWLVFPLRYLFRRRVILYTHGEEISQNGGHAFARLRMTFLRNADAVVSVSLFCKSLIVSKYGIDPAKIFVISNGIDLDTFIRGASDRGVLPHSIRDKKVLLAVSRLVERKGHRQLIEAMPAVLSENPDAHCIIVGDGPQGEFLKALVREMRLETHVTFMGSVPLEELVRLYRASDVFVLPCQTLPDGDTEGFGLVFLEANACALPVVAGAAGGTVEAVVDGETGLLVDGADPRQISGAVLRILNDPALARRLAETGWKRAQQCGWRRITTEFLEVCQKSARRAAKHDVSFPSPSVPNASISSPAKMPTAKPKLLMTVDVEEEFDWAKFSRSDYKVRGIEGLSAFHDDCRRLGVVPTYLLTGTIMDDPDFRDLFIHLLADGSAEIGIHLHSWVTPPFWEHANSFNSFQCNLPTHIERRKLETLCRKYEDCFGKAVTIHRAGRWGGAERTSVLLEEIGIKVDLSPSTGYSSAKTGGPDFTNLNGKPFWSGHHGSVLTLPASAINYLPGPDWMSRAFFASMNRMSAIRSLVASWDYGQAVRFSPEGHSTYFLKGMAEQFVARDLPVVVCAVHSTSLYGGGNPYVRTEMGAAIVRKRNSAILRYCIDTLGFRPATCAEIYTEAAQVRDLAFPPKAA